MIRSDPPDFQVHLAQNKDDLLAAQRLRYDVFVAELGGSGVMVDHGAGLERDEFDDFVDHLLLRDRNTGEVVGVYRLMRPEAAAEVGRYYSSAEYDLSLLQKSGRRLLELGRSCIHRDYRGGVAIHHLWSAVAAYVEAESIDVLFGVASFHGTDINALAPSLSLLHHRHLAPPHLRVRALERSFQEMALMDEVDVDRRRAMRQVPSLIKAYLRLGGCVGDGAFVDHAFNTTDVFMVMDIANLPNRQARIYQTVAT